MIFKSERGGYRVVSSAAARAPSCGGIYSNKVWEEICVGVDPRAAPGRRFSIKRRVLIWRGVSTNLSIIINYCSPGPVIRGVCPPNNQIVISNYTQLYLHVE